MKWEEERLIDEGKPPVWIDQVHGEIKVLGKYKTCSAYALDPNGVRSEKLSVKLEEERVNVIINNKKGAIYYEIIIR